MKKTMKTMVAVVCVAAAGMGGMKAYNTANQSEADMLLAENVEALSSGDASSGGKEKITCYNSIHTKEGCTVVYCGDCTSHPGAASGNEAKCEK